MNYTIRKMSLADLKMVIKWASEEGWNPGLSDAKCFYEADPNGFYIGLLDDKPVASISVIKYNSDYGFLGLYIVRPDFRGQGYGLKIWNEGMKYLKGCNVGLDGVVAQQENYKKSGFKFAYRHLRFETCGSGEDYFSKSIIDSSNFNMKDILNYDSNIFPARRKEFIEKWLIQSGHYSCYFHSNNELLGFATMRRCIHGNKVGPFYANSPEIAEKILFKLKSKISIDDYLYIDVPEINKKAMTIVLKYNMKLRFEAGRMYTKDIPEINYNKIYSITDLAVG